MSLRVAVIGAGSMGRNHARIYGEMAGISFVAAADVSEEAARRAAQPWGAAAYTDYRELLHRVRPDAVSVAVPIGLHFQVTVDALAAGCHVLVEKPLAATVEQGEAMIALAARLGRVLAVGHVERYNPAIAELKRRIDGGAAGRIFQIHARRLGPFPSRVRDAGVVVDLATHDLDTMRYLTGREAERLYAETQQAVNTAHEDLLSGLVSFEGGMLGVLDVNWLTPTKVREIAVTAQKGMWVANLLTQDLYFYENDHGGDLAWPGLSLLRGVSEGQMVRPKLERREPLEVELRGFVAAVQGEPGGVVPGEDGLAALTLALALVRSSRERRVIEC